MQYEHSCNAPNWTPPKGNLIRETNENNKVMLSNDEPQPCQQNPMKNEEEITKENIGCKCYCKCY